MLLLDDPNFLQGDVITKCTGGACQGIIIFNHEKGQATKKELNEQGDCWTAGRAAAPCRRPAATACRAHETNFFMPCRGPMGMTLGWVSPLRAASTGVKVKRCGRADSGGGRVSVVGT